jgi:thiol-disulfide isomerase/thioredoxin
MKLVSRSLLCAGLALAAFAATPRPSPPFQIKRLPGEKPLNLSNYRGKVVALVFISTTCPHCQDLTRKLVPMAKEFGSRVQFLECAIDPTAEANLPGFIQEFQPPFPVGYNSQAAVDQYLQWSAVQIFYVPHIVFLDEKGVIRGDYAGESEFMSDAAENTRVELDKLLAAHASPAKTTARKTR